MKYLILAFVHLIFGSFLAGSAGVILSKWPNDGFIVVMAVLFFGISIYFNRRAMGYTIQYLIQHRGS